MDVKQVLPRDAIPSVDDPQFVPVEAHEGEGEAVVVDPAEVTGDEDAPARAYPLRYLHYHEIVNDVLGSGASGRPEAEARGDRSTPESDPGVAGADRPVAVTWCPLCGSAVVYDRTVDDGGEGRVLAFGVSGKLADDDLEMYDRDTGSEWKQSTGVAVDGPLAGDGTVWDGATGRSEDGRRLDRLPARRLFAMAWADDRGRAAFWAPG